jgi:hypothetical protein
MDRRSPQQQKRVRQSLRRFMVANLSGTANRSTFDRLVQQITIPVYTEFSHIPGYVLARLS